MLINYAMTHFLTSSVDAKCSNVKQNGIEIAFIGYSNSGKSSLINCLTNHNKLARSSKYPGRTRMINFFKVNSNLRLVDLPGYGYASTNRNDQKQLYNLIFSYLNQRRCLKGLILLIDIRRLLRPIDYHVLQLSKKKQMNLIIILTKCDKLSDNSQNNQCNLLKLQLLPHFHDVKFFVFSSIQKIGVEKIVQKIYKWYYAR